MKPGIHKLRTIAVITALGLIASACTTGIKVPGLTKSSVVKATKLWETSPELLNSESALYDAERKVIYVSSINGDPLAKDGNGYISIVDLNGKILNKHWISGLNAPKGLGRVGDRLYVSDINQMIEIDIIAGEVIKKVRIPNARFLNDVTTNEKGEVFISDSNKGSIYRYSNGALTTLFEADTLEGINGIYSQDNKIVIAIWKESHLAELNMDNLKVTTRVHNIFKSNGADGVIPDNKGNYFLSDWNGAVVLVDQHNNVRPVLDTRSQEVRAADIDYLPEEKLLLVPTFPKNSLVAYRINDY